MTDEGEIGLPATERFVESYMQSLRALDGFEDAPTDERVVLLFNALGALAQNAVEALGNLELRHQLLKDAAFGE